MPPTPLACGRVRPAAVVNEEIRALWTDPRVKLTDEERAALEDLYEEWAAATRQAEVVKAA
ncbi:hypothetical protein [Streptomyces spinosisporus]|jgi:hypothetical protein|uniref:Uncharacterized protein n=1 Tax=Streptomyces spinosisporus TaxID=2927582 RepID=A0ABS9XXE9_9ACTN|nr:hypothetical protein [Streptomyces spinosisporus]MCI3246277.1 hypothetical protein [Streptomyces spinosisporus]